MQKAVRGQPKAQPAKIPSSATYPNDLVILAATDEQIRELRNAISDAVYTMRVMRHHDSPLCIAADRLERAIALIARAS